VGVALFGDGAKRLPPHLRRKSVENRGIDLLADARRLRVACHKPTAVARQPLIMALHLTKEDAFVTLPIIPSGPGDFDFVMGDWHVRHHRLRERLVNCQDWVEFEGAMPKRFWVALATLKTTGSIFQRESSALLRCAPSIELRKPGQSGGWMDAFPTSWTCM